MGLIQKEQIAKEIETGERIDISRLEDPTVIGEYRERVECPHCGDGTMMKTPKLSLTGVTNPMWVRAEAYPCETLGERSIRRKIRGRELEYQIGNRRADVAVLFPRSGVVRAHDAYQSTPD